MLSFQELAAQSEYGLQFHSDSNIEKFDNDLDQNFEDSISVRQYLATFIYELHSRHFLEAAVDSMWLIDSTYHAQLHLGSKYEDFEIKYKNPKDGKIKRITSYNQLANTKADLLTNAENNGYPFAEVYLKKLNLDNENFQGELVFKNNQLILIDEIKIYGNAKVDPSFLNFYLDLKKGDALDFSKVRKAQQKLQNLNFVKSSREPKMLFDKAGADIYFFLEDRKASRFDFLLGILPINDPLIERNNIITTLALIDLHNSFDKGEHIYAKFEQLKPITQELELKASLPYLLDSPFGVSTSFDLYRQDSAFIDIDYQLGVRYFLDGQNHLEVFVNRSVTNVLSIASQSIINNRQLPRYLDRQQNSLGVKLKANQLDYVFNPTMGWDLFVSAQYGRKNILKNNDLLELQDPTEPEFNFESLYDPLSLAQNQVKLVVDFAYFIPIGKNYSVQLRLRGGSLFSDGDLLSNEQFRLGGAKFLRGFDEQIFFVDKYLLGTLEYRLLIGRNTYGFVFADIAQTEDRSVGTNSSMRPLGFGAGFSFDTKTGIFNISLALGKDLINDNDFFDIAAPKIHLGYVSLF